MRRSLLPAAGAADGLTPFTMINQQTGTAAIACEGAQVELNCTGGLYDENT